MGTDEYVRVAGCHVKQDSDSGLAYKCEFADGTELWVPYSQTRKREVNKLKVRCDVIEVKRWWADKNEVGYA